MRKSIHGLILISCLMCSSCSKLENRINPIRIFLGQMRRNLGSSINGQAKKDWRFYHAIFRHMWDYYDIEEMLQNGANPNYCRGECGWVDSNPLMILAKYRDSSYTIGNANEIFPQTDVATIKLLINYGADIHKYPYIWEVVNVDSDKFYSELYKNEPLQNEGEELIRKTLFIEDSNRVLQAFLECGADPNKKGHSYPFTYEAVIEQRMKDEKANEYFNSVEATTPLYEAIKKGMGWESQVDLLLQYGAMLDESCLKAAEESGDAAMVEKVKKLLAEINK